MALTGAKAKLVNCAIFESCEMQVLILQFVKTADAAST